MFILSPMCGPLGQLQGLNYSKVDLYQVEAMFREGMVHLEFSMVMCRTQSEKNRLLIVEHLAGARSRVTSIAKGAMSLPGVRTVDFDLCWYRLKSIG